MAEPIPGPKRTVKAEMQRRRTRGRNGEYQVQALFKTNGWPDAFRTPGSGAWRPHGFASVSPYPLDVASGWPDTWQSAKEPLCGPWLVEVKFDQRMAKPSRGLVGEVFIRGTLKEVQRQWDEYLAVDGAYPVKVALFARAANQKWRVFVPGSVFSDRYGINRLSGWIELFSVWQFFNDFAGGDNGA